MSKRTRIGLWVMVGTGLVAVAVVLWPQWRTIAVRVGIARADWLKPTNSARSKELSDVPRVDLAGDYALDYAMRYAAPGAQGGRAEATLDWHGPLRVAHLRTGGGWLGMQVLVKQWHANANLQRVSGLRQEDGALLQQPFAVRLGSDGQVTEVRCAKGVASSACALVAGLAHALQFVRPAGAAGPAWQSEEHDLMGTYAAQYTAQTGGKVRKTWSGSGVQAGQADPLGLTQDTDVAFAHRDGALQAVHYGQMGRMRPALAEGDATTEFSVKIELLRRADQPAAALAALDPQQLERFDVQVAVGDAPPPAVVELASAVEQLAHLESGRQAEHRAAIRAGLIAGLRADDKAVAATKSALLRRNLEERTERTLLEALVGAGTPIAQEAVADLIADEAVAQPLADRALLAATQLQGAGAPFVERLLTVGDHKPAFQSAVAVTLGAVAHDLAPRDAQRARVLVGALLAQARDARKTAAFRRQQPQRQSAVTLMDECNWLAAFGNTGDAAVLPDILAALEDPREPVRISAAHALRFQDAAATHDAMVLHMAHDEAPEVRVALLHAALWQGPKSREAMVQKALFFDKSKTVRLEAAFAVASWSVTAPGLRQMLAKALQREEDGDVQESLRNYLTPGRNATPLQQIRVARETP